MPNRPTLGLLAGRDASETAVIDDWGSLSWGQLEEQTQRMGRGLWSLGATPGTHVALACTNRVEFAVALLGAMRAGLVVTPLKTSWTPHEMAHVTGDAGSSVVITDVDAGRRVADDGGAALVDLDDDHAGWLAGQSPQPLPSGLTGWRMSYTSGTTGKPKGVRRESDATVGFEDAWRSWAAGAEGLGLPREGTHLVASQLFHGAPLAFGLGALARGATLRIMDRWDADRGLELLAEANASVMVPTMFRQLLARPAERRAAFDPGHLVAVLHGGETCPVELKHQMIGWWGPVLTEYYGFTEGGMTSATSAEWLSRPGTVGRPIGAQQVVILDDDGVEVGPGVEGWVHFRRPEGDRAFRYVNEPDQTRAAFRGDAFGVGDIGWVDDDGYLFLSGRSAEVIVAGGVNVYPAEVEEAVFSVAGVRDACVAGGPDPERGEQPVAFIALVPGVDRETVLTELDAACRERLAGYKRPRRVVVRDDIPRDPTGKVLRRQLRDELWRTD